MKNYKNLVPIALILFAILGCYTRLNDSANKQNQYNGYIEEARAYRAEKLYVDAMDSYQSALDMRNTYELCQEIGEMMIETGKSGQIESWGKYIVEMYPKRIEGYEYLVDYYLAQGNYKQCFDYYDIVEKRALSSDTLIAKINAILYEYEIGLGNYDEVEEYSNGYAVIVKDGKYGYVNTTGKVSIKPVYQYAGAFCREYGPIQDENGEFYFVDLEGNRRLNYPADLGIDVTKIGYIGNGLYAVGNDEEVYFVSTDGEIVSGPYEDAGAYADARAAVLKDGKWYMVDLDGNVVSEGYQQFAMDVKRDIYRNAAAFAQTEKGYVMIDAAGKQISSNVYDDARCFLDETYAAVKVGDQWGFVDNQGNMIIEPAYEDALSFANGLAAVKRNGLWGYLNLQGEWAIAPTFADAKSLNEGGCSYIKQEGSEQWSLLKLVRYQ